MPLRLRLRRPALLALIAAGFAAAPEVRADRLWTLQLAGGSLVLSLDAPEERGAVLVFHRHPDGVFSSVRAADVRRITIAEGPAPSKKPAREWEVLVLGRDAEGPDRGAAGAPGGDRIPAASAPLLDRDPGYGAWSWGWAGVPSLPHHRPPVVSPGRMPVFVRPNGFPAVDPPGSPGAGTLPIGPNGFPILGVPAPVPRLF